MAMATSLPVTVLIADRQPLMQLAVSSALSEYPNIRIVGTTRTFAETAAQLVQTKPDLILYNLPEKPGMVQRSISELLMLGLRSGIKVEIALYTLNDEPAYIAAALNAGARGYLNTIHDGVNLVNMITRIAARETYENPDMVAALTHPVLVAARRLTPTEREILRQMVRGAENQQIADDRQIALSTVKKHTTNIYRKLQVENRSQAVSIAIQYDLVDSNP